MCKHVAAVLYGVGVQLDTKPELLFVLRQVDHEELVTAAVAHAATIETAAATGAAEDHDESVLAPDDLSELFGIEISDPETAFLDLP